MIAEDEVVADRDAGGAQVSDLFEKADRIDDQAVADDRHGGDGDDQPHALAERQARFVPGRIRFAVAADGAQRPRRQQR